MFSLLYNKPPHSLSSIFRKFCDLRVLECTPVIISRSLSSTSSDQNQLKETSFTISYLINSCGLSPKEANSLSKKVQFETPDRADSVLALFNKHGFSTSQISKIVKVWPKVLLADPEKNIHEKLEFFSAIGITGTNLATILQTSLINRIIPLYKLLRSTLLFDEQMVIKAMSNASRFFVSEDARIRANILVLREVGMPQTVIQLLLIHHIYLLGYKVDIFRQKLNEAINMGFCPKETKFITALAAFLCFPESNWQHKIEVYVRCGWSKDEVMSAFKKDPRCLILSEKKISDSIEFLVNVMDMKPSSIAAYPYFLSFSLEKRIIPRGLVVKILMSEGVLSNVINFYSVLKKPDKRFLQEYVEKHKKQIPYLLDVFEGRMSTQELGFQYGWKYVDCKCLHSIS